MFSSKLIYLLAAITLQAQTSTPVSQSVPLYRFTVVQSSAKAINYRYLKSSTKIDFKGTLLAPGATGSAKISSGAAITRIKAKFDGLPDPTQFGPEYLTYVLWAISPEGRATNLGEVLLDDGEGKLKVTEPLQAFGLVVTAEPYFAVLQPSDLVVLENSVRDDTKGKVEYIDAKYELLKRGDYHIDAPQGPVVKMDKETPFAVYQARNAVAIARTTGASDYAPDAFGKAERLLAQSESTSTSKKERSMIAREATQSAEDARVITVKREEAELVERDRKEAQAKVYQAHAETAEANAAQAAAENSTQVAVAQNANLTAALATSDKSRKDAVTENANLRQQLFDQLNAILDTRATARGLIVNMSGVTFLNGKSTLLPEAREKLSKIAGVILAHPGLKLEAEGYTDSNGSYAMNQKLSEHRAQAARDFLVAQGVAPSDIGFQGFGEGNPIASNASAEGRQTNRRVELVVSGAGITDGSTGAN